MKALCLALLMLGLGPRLQAQDWAGTTRDFLLELADRDDSICVHEALDSFLKLNPPAEKAAFVPVIPSLVQWQLGKVFSKKMRIHCEATKHTEGKLYYQHCLGLYASFKGDFQIAQAYYETLLEEIKEAGLEDKSILFYIRNIVFFYAGNLHQYNKALSIIEMHRASLGSEAYALFIEVYKIKQDWANVRNYALLALANQGKQARLELDLATALWHLGLRDSSRQMVEKLRLEDFNNHPYYEFNFSLLQYRLGMDLGFDFIESLNRGGKNGYASLFPLHARGVSYAIERGDSQAVSKALYYTAQDTLWSKEPHHLAKINYLIAKGLIFLGLDEQALKALESADHYLNKKNVEQSFILDKRLSFDILAAENQILAKQKQNPQALADNIQKLLPLLDELRQEQHSPLAKQAFIQQQLDLIETTLDFFYLKYQESQNLEWLERGLVISEKTKALLLLDALREDQALSFGRLPDSLRQAERNLKQSLRQLQVSYNQNPNPSLFKELESREQQFHQLKHQLEQNYPDYFRLKYQEIQLSLSEIQEQAQKQELGILHYFLGKQSLHVFYLDEKSSLWAKTQIDSSFQELLLNTYGQLSDAEQVLSQDSAQELRLKQQLRELYLVLTQGLDPTKFPKKLLIVPDGGLHYLPFEVFLSEEEFEQDWSRQAYWLKKNSFQYQYTLSLWLELLGREASAKGGILGLAPNYFEGQSLGGIRAKLKDLSGAEQELNYLAENFKGRYYYREQASEQRFKQELAQAGIVHLAMHGLINDQNPERSALIFQHQGPEEDNILYAYEIPALETEGELIVLSACQTGFGQYQRGEGLLSLSRGFVYAGFPAIVSTLWAINDQASYHLMAGFYGHLAGGRTKSEALREAKLAYLKRTEGSLAAHPFFWAGFVFHGQDRPCQNLHRVWSWYWYLGGFGLGLGILVFWRGRVRGFRGV